jgi:hypothetical protein
MGFIYLATSPSGKNYVGQTTRTVAVRWYEHVHDAYLAPTLRCQKLSAAIRKYGAAAFKVGDIYECPDAELDDWEVFFIGVLESFGPKGYNQTTGGRQGIRSPRGPHVPVVLPAEAPSQDFDFEGPLPRGISYNYNQTTEGFRVRYHGRDHIFTHAGKSMLEKYEEALQCWAHLASGGTVQAPLGRPRVGHYIGLPKYVYYNKIHGSYFVRKPGSPTKHFKIGQYSDAECRALAIAHLKTLP